MGIQLRVRAQLMAAGACLALVSGTLGGCSEEGVQSAGSPPPVASTQKVAEEPDLVADLLTRMSLENKVAQLIQPQINTVTPEEMKKYRWGS